MSLNDFTFGKVLGKGAFGTVTIVTRKEDQKIYAMKRVNIGKLKKNDIESALNEIRILSALNHPNIIAYKDSFYDDKSKTLNIVMEFADDGDIDHKLKEFMRKKLQLDEKTIWDWLIQILEGLKFLNDNKVMHRDLKCANIFLTKDGVVKIGDLNVSKIAELGKASTQTGTPYYCSPEIWRDLPYDFKCDIWSVGCILYELCTFRPPFRGNSLKELSQNVMKGYYMPIPSFYSRDLKKVIEYMLVVDPKKRIGINELINTEIIQRKIKESKNSVIKDVNLDLKNSSKKANFIKTIKMPMNLKDINLKLPKKKYRPEEEMFKYDHFEITKQTFMQTIKKQMIEEEKPKIDNKPVIMQINNYNINNNYNCGNNYLNKGPVKIVDNDKIRDVAGLKGDKDKEIKNSSNNNNNNNNNIIHNNNYSKDKNDINKSNCDNNISNNNNKINISNNDYNNKYNNNISNNNYNINQISNNKNSNREREIFKEVKNEFKNMPKIRPQSGKKNNNKIIINNNKNVCVHQRPVSGRKNVDNLHMKYRMYYKGKKPDNKIKNNFHPKNYGFKYVKPKNKPVKVNYNKFNYNDYCKNNNVDRNKQYAYNKNYHYNRGYGMDQYNKAMKVYGDINLNVPKNEYNKVIGVGKEREVIQRKGPRIIYGNK